MVSFDSIATHYDQLWTKTPVGDLQRRAVWSFIDSLFPPGSSVLDLGCGTGVDAVHLRQMGVNVFGIDSSREMIRIARNAGIAVRVCGLENLSELVGKFDGAISNFGALNCTSSLSPVAKELGRLIRPGGFAALCFLGRVCLWEIGYYSIRGNIRKAMRRLSGHARSSLGIEVLYPTRRAILHAFKHEFVLCGNTGVGLTVPPSYVSWLSRPTLEKLAGFDRRTAASRVLRSLSDHQLYIWRRR